MKKERLYPTTFISEFKCHIDTALALHSAACDLLEGKLTRRTTSDENPIGRAAGGTVLEALAIELLLKERQKRAGVVPVIKIHRHDRLFEKLPPPEKEVLRRRYESACPDRFSSTLDEALALSSKLFEVWRYAHESSHVRADIEELVYVFEVLLDGL